MPNDKWVADLKTVLQVAKARLDVREKKKTEQVAKERYTVADYIRNNKVPRGRIGKYFFNNYSNTIRLFQLWNIWLEKIIKSKPWIELKHMLIHF
jgi:hypothetical protein